MQIDGEGATSATNSSALERELTRARERIAFYEGFDRLIQENIARSGDLLRQAAEQREAAIREVEQSRAELDRRRGEQRATLTVLAEELLGLQRRVGELTGRVMAAIDDLGSNGPLMAPPPTLADAAPPPTPPPDTLAAATDASRPLVRPAAAADPSLSSGDDPHTFAPGTDVPRPDGAADAAASTSTGHTAPSATVITTATVMEPPSVAPTAAIASPDTASMPEAEPPEPAERPGGPPPSASPDPAARDAVSADLAGDATDQPEAPHAVAVVVHGMPRAAAALALQRHLAGLPQVDAVEAREYVAGVLRLQVTTRAPLTLADLQGWSGGDLAPITVLPEVMEVRMPSGTDR